MGDVVKWNGITRLPIPVDDVLEGAKGKLDYVLLIGWDKNGEFYAATNRADPTEAVYAAEKFIHKEMNEDYGEYGGP